MKKKRYIVIIILVVLIFISLLGLFLYKNSKLKEQVEPTKIYDKNGQVVADLSKRNEIVETKENISIQGIVELHHNGYIYIFNGQHFGEFGFGMDEYTRANILDKNQKCIDYMTSEEHDTSYIEEGDLIICSGDLYVKGYGGENDFDTKDNPIIVLKSGDYTEMKKEVLNGNGKYSSVVTIGEDYADSGYVYLKYTLEDDTNSDTGYNFPFGIKAYIAEDTKIEGDLQNGSTVEVEYKDLTEEPFDELNLKSIKVLKN